MLLRAQVVSDVVRPFYERFFHDLNGWGIFGCVAAVALVAWLIYQMPKYTGQ